MPPNTDPIVEALKAKLNSAYRSANGPINPSALSSSLPADYADFLKEIGGGTIGEMVFQLYDKPLVAKQIYGDNAPARLNKLLFIGDDYNGFCVALDPSKNWAVVEVDKLSLETELLAESFFDFLMKDWRLAPPDE